MNAKKWVEILEVNDHIQANIFKGLLEAQGVMVMISQEGYQQAIGITGAPNAMVSLLVPDDQETSARQVLDDYEKGLFEIEDPQ